jgi:hypothetical protein
MKHVHSFLLSVLRYENTVWSVSVAKLLKRFVDLQATRLLEVTLTSKVSNFLQLVTAWRKYEILRCETLIPHNRRDPEDYCKTFNVY